MQREVCSFLVKVLFRQKMTNCSQSVNMAKQAWSCGKYYLIFRSWINACRRDVCCKIVFLLKDHSCSMTSTDCLEKADLLIVLNLILQLYSRHNSILFFFLLTWQIAISHISPSYLFTELMDTHRHWHWTIRSESFPWGLTTDTFLSFKNLAKLILGLCTLFLWPQVWK